MRTVRLFVLLLAGCTGTIERPPGRDAGHDASSPDASARVDAGAPDAGPPDTGPPDAGPPDPCGGALLCESFEGYEVASLSDGETFGPWRAALQTPGGAMDIDSTHTTSGEGALHVRIDAGVTAGGRLFTNGTVPLTESLPTHIWGRMMMYIDPNGSSVHWTFFGASGDAEASSPVTGRRATYLLSSLPRAGVNTYSFVYGLEASGSDPYHDCWSQGMEPMPTARWTCVSFELDGIARRLRFYVDGRADPVAAVDDTGQGCVGSVPGDSLWYGPAIDQLYVGAWSFHPMEAPLDVWIDDLVVDTSPVACPAS